MSKFGQISSNTEVDKALVGLANVDNTSDADKPISNAVQNALDNKEDGLGTPDTDDYILSSKADGTRSWIEPPSGAQADYAETDTGADSYIKNKPDLSVYHTKYKNVTDAMSGSSLTVTDSNVTADSGILWTASDTTNGYIEITTDDGQFTITSTADETVSFTYYIIK